ncbi:unnamed protein product [Caretta caretta]
MELEAMSRYTSPVNPAVFPHLTVVLLAIGMFFTAWFFVYPPATEQPGSPVKQSKGSQGALHVAPAPKHRSHWSRREDMPLLLGAASALGVEDEVGKAAWQKPFKPWKQSL